MAVLILLTGLLIVACKKDEPMQVNQNTNTELDDHSAKVLNLIKTFDAKMNSTLKGDERIHIDSVVWNSEALQNYNYAFPDTSTKNFVVYREDYTLSVNASNMALLSDVQSLNTQIEDNILDKLDEIDSDEAFLRFCDVVLDSIVSNTAFLSAINGFGYDIIFGYYGFDDDDDWIWGTLSGSLAGKCDGTMVGVSDGSNELVWRLNNLLFHSGSQSGTGWTNVETITKIYSDFSFVNGQPRIYVDPTATVNNCLYDTDLVFYLEQADGIIYSYSPDGARPSGKEFMSINIVDEMISGSGGFTNYLHKYQITYGMPYTNTN
jgi:hypothetical protein